MRILFERNIANKYVDALAAESWTTVELADDHFAPTADDEEIAEFAAKNEWVVFTTDDDFFGVNPQCGVIWMDQQAGPIPGEVVAAVEKIRGFYTDHSSIRESVPGPWI